IVSYLTEELVRLGHDVTLFASGDSKTSARLVSALPVATRLNPAVHDPLPHLMVQLEQVRQRADEFDILHFHIDAVHLPLARELAVPTVTTLHGPLDLPDLQPLYRAFSDLPLVSISNHQRQPMPPVNWAGTVYHGLPDNHLAFSPTPGAGYLAFLGRITPEKRVDRAIEIAARLGKPLRIAAKIDKVDREYWATTIAPLVEANANVEYVGEITDADKSGFLGNAEALLFPIDWPEPFGIVMIEAMACGTPVVAFPCGSVPEVIEHGVSGYIVNDVDEAVEAVRNIGALDRGRVRAAFARRFTARRMARDYLAIYESLLERRALAEVAPVLGPAAAGALAAR
ncbi:MAG TPA: glycosyltransferase family 4 protein, partial [Alphaproteobacteria bacterium]|nr:glycosyltransferase family 4 protein [Alphaproteobacteria bacterium]